MQSERCVSLLQLTCTLEGSAAGYFVQPTGGREHYGTLVAAKQVWHSISFLLNALIENSKMSFAVDLCQSWTLGAIKLSVVHFYRSIFRGKVFDSCSKVLISAIIIWSIAFFFGPLFQCKTNFWAIWDVWSTQKYIRSLCLNCTPILKTFLIFDVFTDVLILGLPVPVVCSVLITNVMLAC